MIADLTTALADAELCRYLDATEIEILARFLVRKTFATGDIISHQGQQNQGVYLILSGKVAMMAQTVGAGIIQLDTAEAGGFAGGISLLGKRPHSASVIAEEFTECAIIPHTYFAAMTLLSPSTKYKIHRAIAEHALQRMKTKQEKMTAFMVETNMASGSVFGEVMQSLARPKESSLEQAEIPIQQLRRLDFFSALSEDEFQWIVKNATLYDAARHTTIIKEGENDTSLYFIVRGAVQSRLKKQHKVAKLAVMSPLHLFCSTALIDESITIIDFAACERTFYFKFSPATLLQLSEEHSRLWYQLHDLMYEAIGNLEQAANRLDIRLTSELYNR